MHADPAPKAESSGAPGTPAGSPPRRTTTTAPDLIVPPGPAAESDLRWRRRPMVRWLAPDQLAATGMRALLSSIFGAYADRREVQAALHQAVRKEKAEPEDAASDGVVYRYDDRGDPTHGFWIDFVADLGDGFDATYTIAWLLAQPTLPGHSTRRGDVLVMGGDQVYPTASRDEYANRLAGPYEAALPWCTDVPPPHLYALPGNHDWYDGLTAFLRLFCQRRWVGGWKTQQRRSYFALQLPNRWWLLGLDAQLESDIDQPQREYFCKVAEQMQPGDRVILCTAEPAWVHTPTEPAAFDTLSFFEKTVLVPRGVDVALTLTGDLHHYARYSDAVRPDRLKHHKITAGGGGAYLLGTQLLPSEIELSDPTAKRANAPAEVAAPRRKERPKERYTREAAYPSTGKSTAIKWGALSLPWKNPSFGVFLGVMYAIFAWFIQSASKLSMVLEPPATAGLARDLMTFAKAQPPRAWPDILNACWDAAAHAPLVMAFVLLIVGGLIAFCAPDVERSRTLRRLAWLRNTVRVAVGLVQGVSHLALAIVLIWMFSWANLALLPEMFPGALGEGSGWNVDHIGQAALFLVEMALFGGAAGAVLLSLFLLPGLNHNEAFSAQHLEGYKNFLRLHIAPDGTLAVYPYGVERPARWRFRPNAPPGQPYYVADPPPVARVIDGPIVLAPPPVGA